MLKKYYKHTYIYTYVYTCNSCVHAFYMFKHHKWYNLFLKLANGEFLNQ